MKRLARSIAILALGAVAVSGYAQSVVMNTGRTGTFAIRNATLHPVSAPPIANGTLVISGGKITAMGAGVVVPAGATVIDGSGLSVYPGMIDSATTVGLTEVGSVRGTNDVTEFGDLNPNARAAVAINPNSNLIPVARVNGVTNVIARPQGGLFPGQGALIRLAGWTPDEMIVKSPAAVYVNFPQARTPPFSDQPQDEEAEKKAKKEYGDRLQRIREVLRDARAYGKAAAAKNRPRGFERDLILEALVPAVERRVPVVIVANRAADIRAALKFAEEEKLDMILEGGQDVQRVLPELKQRNVPVILGPIWSLPPREDDPYDLIFTNAAALHRNGIRFAISTGDAHDVRNLPYQAASAAAFGLPKEEALKAVTLYPAQIWGVADRLGSLEVGKSATLFVTDGDPLEIRTTVRHVFIEGQQMPGESLHTILYEKFKRRVE